MGRTEVQKVPLDVTGPPDTVLASVVVDRTRMTAAKRRRDVMPDDIS
jgi:hypothetical protein